MEPQSEPWPPGTPCWADLASPDREAAKTFYSATLGWSFKPTGPEHGNYVLCHIDDDLVAGIGSLNYRSKPSWMIYFASTDVVETAEAISANGGSIVVPPQPNGDYLYWLVAQDPQGALFGVWQPQTQLGTALVNVPGAFTWADLRVADPDASRDFYHAVFGYAYEEVPDEITDPGYSTFSQAGQEDWPSGGIGTLADPNSDAHWQVYFGVADAEQAVDAAVISGGAVLRSPWNSPYGRMATLTDPAGATFSIIEMSDD